MFSVSPIFVNHACSFLTVAVAETVGVTLGASCEDAPPHLKKYVTTDATAKFIFENFAASEYMQTGAFIVASPTFLDELNTRFEERDGELAENELFAFAGEGDGSFYVFNIRDRSVHLIDFAQWCSPGRNWERCCLESWNSISLFCDRCRDHWAEDE